jgi:hypothetical protein
MGDALAEVLKVVNANSMHFFHELRWEIILGSRSTRRWIFLLGAVTIFLN